LKMSITNIYKNSIISIYYGIHIIRYGTITKKISSDV